MMKRRTFMRFRKEVFFLATAVLFFLSPSSDAGIMVVGGLTQEKVAVPGENYKGEIVVRNTGDELEQIKVYQTDYLFFCDGTSDYGDPNRNVRSNAGWIRFSPKRVSIPAGEEVVVAYEVGVPQNNSLIGTYWSMMMVEGFPKESPELKLPQNGVGISTVVRYGVQMVTHIGESGRRELKFLSVTMLKENSSHILQVDVENIGERLLRQKVWADVYNDQGKHLGKFEGNPLRIYPGTSVRNKIDLQEIPQGTYKILVVADCGGEDLFGAHYTVKIGE